MSKFIDIDLDPVSAKKFKASLKDYGEDAYKAILNGIQRLALKIESDAKLRLRGRLGSARHWVTGRLASSVHTETSQINSFKMESSNSKLSDGNLRLPIADDEAIVGTNVEYAEKIEFDYDSFLRFSAQRNEKNLVKYIEKELNAIK